jgi:tetratricopeptide (TPR) repeat protein
MSPGQANQLAIMWRKADRPEKALEVMRHCLDFDRATLDRYVVNKRGPARSYYRFASGFGGKNRRNPFSFNFDNSYSSWWSSTSRGVLHRHRTFVAALLWQTGDVERAEAVEQALLDQSTIRRRQKRLEELAAAYRTHGAYPQAARLLRVLLGDDRFDIEDKKRDQLLDNLITSLGKSEDEEGFREVTRERRRLLEERIAAQPGPHAFELRATIAKLLIEKIGDCSAGLEHVDFILRFKPSNPTYRNLRATTLIRMGRVTEGIGELRELSRFRRRHGQDDTLTEQAWLGIGLARSGATDEAKRVLTRVLQRLAKDSELRRLVEDALERA